VTQIRTSTLAKCERSSLFGYIVIIIRVSMHLRAVCTHKDIVRLLQYIITVIKTYLPMYTRHVFLWQRSVDVSFHDITSLLFYRRHETHTPSNDFRCGSIRLVHFFVFTGSFTRICGTKCHHSQTFMNKEKYIQVRKVRFQQQNDQNASRCYAISVRFSNFPKFVTLKSE